MSKPALKHIAIKTKSGTWATVTPGEKPSIGNTVLVLHDNQQDAEAYAEVHDILGRKLLAGESSINASPVRGKSPEDTYHFVTMFVNGRYETGKYYLGASIGFETNQPSNSKNNKIVFLEIASRQASKNGMPAYVSTEFQSSVKHSVPVSKADEFYSITINEAKE